eukprot:SAG11_NODE_9192_length_934_cov_1.098204_2_plen_43_part_01
MEAVEGRTERIKSESIVAQVLGQRTEASGTDGLEQVNGEYPPT